MMQWRLSDRIDIRRTKMGFDLSGTPSAHWCTTPVSFASDLSVVLRNRLLGALYAPVHVERSLAAI